MKSSDLLVVVDSVEEAIKFYTEKLAFDIAHIEVSKENPQLLSVAYLRKAKCVIIFRTPHVEELAEFSFIKRCASRCVGLHIEMKRGLEKYFKRCQKKSLKVTSEPKDHLDGYRSFSLRDPFGIKLVFYEALEGKQQKPSLDFIGMKLNEQDVMGKGRKEADLIDMMVDHLRNFGILRRARKKYSKLRLKQFTAKPKNK